MKRLDGNEKRSFTLPAVKGEEIDALYVRPAGELVPFSPPFLQLPFGLVMDCVYMIISKEKTFLEDKTGY